MPVLTALENVEFVLELQGVGPDRRDRARAVLQELGLADLADRRPSELSGGQQQRVAVARAIAARPALVLADEPTANLDGENAEILMHMMRDLRDRHGMTFIFSTHDPRVVAHAVRVVTLVDGRVARDEVTPGEAPHEIVPGIGKAPASRECVSMRRVPASWSSPAEWSCMAALSSPPRNTTAKSRPRC